MEEIDVREQRCVQVEVPIGGTQRRPIEGCVTAIARFCDRKVWVSRDTMMPSYVSSTSTLTRGWPAICSISPTASWRPRSRHFGSCILGSAAAMMRFRVAPIGSAAKPRIRCDLFIGQHRRISRLRPASSHLPGH